MENGSETKKRYRAFISYSQLDKKWAKKLHQALESYRVPLGVVAQIDTSSRRIGRIFRDEDEMGASESLGAALEGALDDSESLIVICSPNSAKSEWVDMEVKRFKRNPQAQILAVIVAGKPNSGDEQTECFCPALRFRVDANGELTDIPDEPLAPDLRKDGLGKLTTRLVAGILGVSFDELWNREQRRRFAARLKFTGLVAATMLGITAIGGQYLRNQNAERASQIINFSRLAMQDAMTLQLEADRASGFERGLRFAVMASRTSTLHPEQPAARKLLRFGAQRSRALGTMTGHRGGVQYAGFMQNAENVVSWGKDNFIRIWQVRTGQLISEHQISGRIIAADASSTQLVVSDDRGGLSVLRTIDMQRTTLSEREQLVQDLAAFDVTGTLLVTAARSGSVVTLWDTKANRTLGSFVPGWEMPLAAIKLSNDGSLLAVACLDGTLKVWNSKTRELVLAADTEVSRKHSLTFAPDNSVIVSNYRGKSSLFNIEHGKLLGLIEGKVVYSPDASHIAVVNEDNNIEIRKSDSAQLISTLKGHQDVINNVA
ncbi:MAG: TIR domain-containing protein, partial [Arenicella sp.]|nr:TIR domain-containing protein [Arenicella sp.]